MAEDHVGINVKTPYWGLLAGGGGGSRTPVRKGDLSCFYVRSLLLSLTARAPADKLPGGQPAKSYPVPASDVRDQSTNMTPAPGEMDTPQGDGLPNC